MINLDRHRATSSAPRTQQLDEVHHERLEICRPISFRRRPPVSRPKRTHLELVCEALESRQLFSTTASSTPDLSQITAQLNEQVLPLVVSGPTGYTPQQIQNAYGVNQITFSGGKAGNGAGQTIAIVTAYSDPNINSDLATFDRQFGLFAPASFKVDNLDATTTDPGWAWKRRSTSSGPTPWLPEPISFWSKLLRPPFPACSVQSITPDINRASPSSR